jgi:membrane protein involved in colicin uptake
VDPDSLISLGSLVVSGAVAVIALKTFSKKTDDDRTNRLERRIEELTELDEKKTRRIEELEGDAIQSARELQACKDARYEMMQELYNLRREVKG